MCNLKIKRDSCMVEAPHPPHHFKVRSSPTTALITWHMAEPRLCFYAPNGSTTSV